MTRLVHGGRTYVRIRGDHRVRGTWPDSAEQAHRMIVFTDAEDEKGYWLVEEAVREGTLTDDDGTPLPEAEAQRLRDRLLGTYDDVPSLEEMRWRSWRRAAAPATRDFLIPDLWPWGTIPFLGGNPKAGKTTMVIDLVASLVVPGRRFLDHFEEGPKLLPTNEGWDHEHDLDRGIVVVNGKDLGEDYDRRLVPALGDREDYVTAIHLEDLGGPEAFDLTNPKQYDLWAHQLIECEECDGGDDRSPLVVIVDDLTAILCNDTARYGPWFSCFRRLMRQIDVPNALVTAHNTMRGSHLAGGIEAMAGPHALWTCQSTNPDNPDSQRRFQVVPGLGGTALSPTVVRLDPDGRLRLGKAPRGPTEPMDPVPTGPTPEQTEAEALAYVRRCNASGHGPTARQLRENVRGPNPLVDQAVARMVEQGRLLRKDRVGRGGGFAYWLPDADLG